MDSELSKVGRLLEKRIDRDIDKTTPGNPIIRITLSCF